MSKELLFFVQKQVSEELALFPSRVAQYLFLLNTLEKQSQAIETKTEHLKNEILSNANSSQDKTELCEQCKTVQNRSYCNCREASLINALNELFKARRKILKDKIFVNEKAIEWTKRAQRALDPFKFGANDYLLECPSTTSQQEDQRSSRKSTPSSEQDYRRNSMLLGSSFYHEGFSSYNTQFESSYSNQSGSTNMALRHTEQRDATVNPFTCRPTNRSPIFLDPFDDNPLPVPFDAISSFHSRKKRRGSVALQSNRSVLPHPAGSSFYRQNSFVIHELNDTRKSALSQETSSFHTESLTYCNTTHSDNQLNSSQNSSIPADSSLTETASQGLIIKLGSQKRRKRKSSNVVRQTSNSLKPVTNTKQDIKKIESHEPSSQDSFIAEEDTDDSMCPVCQKVTSGQMVQCDRCDRWCHCVCVGFIVDAKAAEKPFCCPRCCNISA